MSEARARDDGAPRASDEPAREQLAHHQPVSEARPLWDEGREPGRQVVALGLAVALTAVGFDLALGGELSFFFDLSFIVLCLGLALVVNPHDFFTVGVLPPLLMVGVFTLLGIFAPGSIADPEDGAVQAVVSGLSHHSGALVVGYVLCLAALAVRHSASNRRPIS